MDVITFPVNNYYILKFPDIKCPVTSKDFPSSRFQCPFLQFLIKRFDRLGDNISTISFFVIVNLVFPSIQTGISNYYKSAAFKILVNFFFKFSQWRLFITFAAKDIVSNRQSVCIKEQAILYDRIRSMFLAFAIFTDIIFIFYFKIKIGAVIIKDTVIAFAYVSAVFIQLAFNEIPVISYNRQRTIYIFQFIFRRLDKMPGIQVRRAFRPGINYSCTDKIGDNGIKIKFKMIWFRNIFRNIL